MVWGVIVIGIIFVLVGYVVIQGTRAASAWRKAATAGDIGVIQKILEEAIGGWRSSRRPKEVPPEIWRGIQSMELVEVGPDSVRVSCSAESEKHPSKKKSAVDIFTRIKRCILMSSFNTKPFGLADIIKHIHKPRGIDVK